MLGATECGLLRRTFANTLMRSHYWFGNATGGMWAYGLFCDFPDFVEVGSHCVCYVLGMD